VGLEAGRKVSNPSTSYDVLPFSDGNGKVYMGNLRAASYHWEGPGHTAVTLEGRDPSGRRIAHSGTCNEIDLAESTCVIWVTEGRISENFRKAE